MLSRVVGISTATSRQGRGRPLYSVVASGSRRAPSRRKARRHVQVAQRARPGRVINPDGRLARLALNHPAVVLPRHREYTAGPSAPEGTSSLGFQGPGLRAYALAVKKTPPSVRQCSSRRYVPPHHRTPVWPRQDFNNPRWRDPGRQAPRRLPVGLKRPRRGVLLIGAQVPPDQGRGRRRAASAWNVGHIHQNERPLSQPRPTSGRAVP